MFYDEAEIYVEGGRGGDGVVSFRRERFVPRGGPDGGDGGDGGSVVLVADPTVGSLRALRQRTHVRAEAGRPGEGGNRQGRKGRDVVLQVPCGTLVYDRDRGLLLRDLVAPGDRVVAARGGRGGKGNRRFATATHQTPRRATRGEPGEKRWLRLELKLIADVGLVGLPNAGKSTLLSRISAARPRVAPYPFTTLGPHLGLVELPDYRAFAVADLPGLVAGAHAGRGLGRRFLRHVERTRVLVFLLDPTGPTPPLEALATLERELKAYRPELCSRPRLLVATKADLWAGRPWAEELSRALAEPVCGVSAVTGEGVAGFLAKLAELLAAAPLPQPPSSACR